MRFLVTIFHYKGSLLLLQLIITVISCSALRLTTTCARNCTCEQSLDDLVVDCSNRVLREIPRGIPSNVTVLLLGGNFLREIPRGVLSRFPNLRKLDFSHSKIVDEPFKIHPDSLVGLKSLRELNLEQLDSGEVVFPQNLSRPFRHVANLRVLNLRRVFVRDDGRLNFVMQDLLQVRYFAILFKPENTFPDGFAYMKNLKVLDLTQSGFRSLNSSTFMVLNKLSIEALSLRQISYDVIDPLALTPIVRSLKILEFSCPQTRHNDPDVFAPVLPGLENSTNLEALILDSVYAETDKCRELNANQFRHVRHSGLKALVARGNCITTLGKFHRNMHHVEYLNLDYNPLIYDKPINVNYFSKLLLSNFKEVHLSNRVINYDDINLCYEEYNYEFFKQLRNYELDPKTLCSRQNHQQQVLNTDNVPRRKPRTIVKIQVSLEILNMSNNGMQFTTKSHGECHLHGITCTLKQNITSIDFSYNNAQKINISIEGWDTLKYLNFGYNKLEYIRPPLFSNLTALETLLLASNRLGVFMKIRDLVNLFSGIQKVETIDLSDNSLTAIPKEMFSDCPRLKGLILQSNPLANFDLQFSQFPRLGLVDLQSCQIREFSNRQVRGMKMMASVNINMKNVAGFDCENCNNFEFFEMIQNNVPSSLLVDVDNLTCTADDLSTRKIVDLSLSSLMASCLKVAIISSTVGVTSLVAIATIVWNYRWNIRYLQYLIRMTWRNRGEPQHNAFDYDFYLSYDDHDYQFAFVLRQGATERGLRVFYWDIDSAPGSDEYNEVFEKLERSKKVVVCLTQNSARSERQMFEMRMSAVRGKGFILPVIKENLPVGDLPRVIRQLLRDDLYLEWPEVAADEDQFWKNLRGAVVTPGGIRLRRNGCVAYYGN